MLSPYLLWLKNLFDFAKKALLVIIVFAAIIGLFAHSIFGNKSKPSQDNLIQKNREQVYKMINDPKFNSSNDGKIVISIYRLIMCGAIGETCTNNPADGDKNYNNSLFGFVSNLIILPYANPPASGIYWAYSGLQNAGFIPKAYAEGIGSASLRTFAPVWDAFRKLSYLVLVLVIVGIGFMIMFRAKLNPQTVITVENALPRIVITLLMITFSYAIVGFAIDIMYLISVLTIELVGRAGGLPNINGLQTNFITSNLLFSDFIWGRTPIYIRAMYSLVGVLHPVLQSIIYIIFSFIGLILTLRFVPPLANIITGLLADVNGGVAGFFNVNVGHLVGTVVAIIVGTAIGFLLLNAGFLLIIVVGLLFLAFRILFLLLSSLIQVILYLIFAPLLILREAIPGQSAFSGWFKNIIGNLIVFPAVIFLILLTIVIDHLYLSNQATFTPPLLGGINTDVLAPLINISVFMMIPDLVKMLKQQIIGKEGLQIPAGPGALFGGIGGVVGSGMGLFQQVYYMQMGLSALTGKKDQAGKVTEPGMFSSIGETIRNAFRTPGR